MPAMQYIGGVLVCILLTVGFLPSVTVGAPSPTPTEANNATRTPQTPAPITIPENGTGNTTTGGDGMWSQLGGMGKAVTNAGKAFLAWILSSWLVEQLAAVFHGILDLFIGLIVGTPYPTNSGAYGIFGTPTNDPWTAYFHRVYLPFSVGISILLLFIYQLGLGLEAVVRGLLRRPSRTDDVARTAGATVAITAWWWVGTFLARLNDELARFIAPSVADLTTSLDGFLKLGSTTVLTGVAAYSIGATEMLVLGLLYATRHALIIVYQLTMPVLLVNAIAAPHPYLRRFFGSLSWHYLTLLVLIHPAAYLLRIGYESEWDFGLGLLGDVFIGLGFFGAAILSVGILGWTSITMHRAARHGAQVTPTQTVGRKTAEGARAGRTAAVKRVKDRSPTLRAGRVPGREQLRFRRGSRSRGTAADPLRPFDGTPRHPPQSSTRRSTDDRD